MHPSVYKASSIALLVWGWSLSLSLSLNPRFWKRLWIETQNRHTSLSCGLNEEETEHATGGWCHVETLAWNAFLFLSLFCVVGEPTLSTHILDFSSLYLNWYYSSSSTTRWFVSIWISSPLLHHFSFTFNVAVRSRGRKTAKQRAWYHHHWPHCRLHSIHSSTIIICVICFFFFLI